jgi:ATP-dependent RNA helicase HelY
MDVTTQTAEALGEFTALYQFPLDDFQIAAIETFMAGDSVMVAAPTGTGKTVVAEFGVYESFRRGGQVIYTTPIKALSNQKFRDLRVIYGDQVGLLTGDVTENSRAPVLVMTTEVLRNMLLQTPWDLDSVDCVIFDEVHYIADQERGTTWEEAIILCPEHIQLICLSATVSNADEIADWISRTHRPVQLITHDQRAIPLALYYYLDKKLRPVIDHNGVQVGDFPKVGGEIRHRARQGGMSPAQMRKQAESEEPQPWEILNAMGAKEMLPAIYFLFSRRDCEENARRYSMMRPNLVRDDATRASIQATLDAHLGSMREEDRELQQVKLITALASEGIGFHHAGLLPILKQLVEVLFIRGLMQVVFATDTLALGVNMPARSVVIGRMSKWDGRRQRMLIPNEFSQMAGRAGRRGMDLKGNIVVPYSPWVPFPEMLKIATGELEPVISAFAIRYNTVLNLWDPPHGHRVRQVLQQSLAQFQSARRARDLEDDIVGLGERIGEIPQGCLIGLDAGDELLDDYRGFNHSINALRGKQRNLERELKALKERIDSRPWPTPGRQALRKVFRVADPGVVVHSGDDGWGVYLGKSHVGGIGLFLFDSSVKLLSQYKEIDYLPSPDLAVQVPDDLLEITRPTDELPQDAVSEVERQVKDLPLPDLAAEIEAHRQAVAERHATATKRLEDQIAEVRAQVREAERTQQEHPCHECPRRKEHQKNLQYINALERERGAVEAALLDEVSSENERIRGIIRGIRNVLHRFDYLHRGYPTAKADLLADVFDRNGLVICEMIDRGLVDSLSAADLAEVFSWYAFDRDSRLRNTFNLPNHLVLLRRRLEDLEQRVVASERSNGLYISTGHNAGFYGGMRAWCNGATMAQIIEKIDMSEGDLVLTFNKTIDLMRQVREMFASVAPNHPLRATLRECERLVKRDIVEQSLILGVMPVGESENGETEDVAESEDGLDLDS